MRGYVLIASYAYSFINQGNALAKGFQSLGTSVETIFIEKPQDILNLLLKPLPDFVIVVSNWTDYENMMKPFVSKTTLIPWIVCDDYQLDKFVDEYNKLLIVVTPSEHSKRNLIRSGLKAELIEVIPEAVDLNIWHPILWEETKVVCDLLSTPNPDSQTIKFDLTKAKEIGVSIFYTTGGDATKKGVQEVMRALALLDKSLLWIYLIKTWSHPNIFAKSIEELKLAQELGISGRVKYIAGEFSSAFMLALMNIADVYVGPSHYEGFGLPLVEAQLCGKPVVTCEGTAAPETVVHQKTGLICRAKKQPDNSVRADIEDLSIHLSSVISDTQLRQKMGLDAKIHAEKYYAPEVIAQTFLNLIRVLTKSCMEWG